MAAHPRRIGQPETAEWQELVAFYQRLDAPRRRLEIFLVAVLVAVPVALGAMGMVSHTVQLATVSDRSM